MLFPGIAFQLMLLCPHSTKRHFSLPPPPAPQWYAFILAIALAAGATVCPPPPPSDSLKTYYKKQ